MLAFIPLAAPRCTLLTSNLLPRADTWCVGPFALLTAILGSNATGLEGCSCEPRQTTAFLNLTASEALLGGPATQVRVRTDGFDEGVGMERAWSWEGG